MKNKGRALEIGERAGGGGGGGREWEGELIYFKVKGKITRGVTFFDYLYMLSHSHYSYLHTIYGIKRLGN